MQQPPQRRTFPQWYRTQTKTARILLGLVPLIAVLVICTCSVAVYGNSLPKPAQSTQAPTATTAPTSTPTHAIAVVPTPTATTASIPTQQPTATPIAVPTATPKPTQSSGLPATHNAPRLGSPLSDFIGAYGQPNDHSTPGQSYHFLRGANSNIDGLIITPDLVLGTQQIDDITVAATSDPGWTLADAATRCLPYMPTDARLKQRIPYAGGTGYDMVYTSSSLAKLFPASEFTDASGNPAPPGTFDIQYLYAGASDQQHIVDCDLLTGSQQTNG